MSNMADLSNILANGVIFSTLKHTDPHTVRGRPTLKDGSCNERIFRNGSFRLHTSLVAIPMESVTYNNTFQGIEINSWKVRTNDIYSRVAMH